MAKSEAIKLTTPVFRVSFPSLFEKSSFNGGTEKFSVTAIWTPSRFSEAEKALWKALLAELEGTSQAVLKKAWKSLPSNNRGLRDGVEKELDGFGEGTRFASLSSLMKPGVFDFKTGKEITDPDEIYPGCYGRATVNVYGYNNASKGVAIGLRNFQKIKDGPRLDGRGDGSKDFDGADVDDSWLEDHTDNLLTDDSIDF